MDVEVAPSDRRMLARFVLWTKNGQLPLWRMVPFEVGKPITLRSLPWVVAACEHVLLTPLEHLQNGLWRALRLDTAEFVLYDYSNTQLVRLLGVEHCPLLGLELEDIDRHLGIPRPPTVPFVYDDRIDLSLRHVRLVLWTQDGEPAMHHRVSFNDDNTLQLALHAPLDQHLYPWTFVEIWLADTGDWEVVSTLNSFQLEAHFDTLLVKLPGVTVMPGFGRELHQLESPNIRSEDMELESIAVTEEIMTDVHEGVPAWYDVAMTTRNSRALLRDIANRELGASEMHAHVMTNAGTLVYNAHGYRGGTKRKRTGEGDRYEPPRFVRRRLSHA